MICSRWRRRCELALLVFLAGCQCGPTGRVAPDAEARRFSVASFEYQLGINCQEQVK